MCIIAEWTAHKLALGAQFLPTTIMQRVPHTANRAWSPTPAETYLHNARKSEWAGAKENEEEKMMTAQTVSYWETRIGQVWTRMPWRAIIVIHCTGTHSASQPASQLVSPSEWDKRMNSVEKYDARHQQEQCEQRTTVKRNSKSKTKCEGRKKEREQRTVNKL